MAVAQSQWPEDLDAGGLRANTINRWGINVAAAPAPDGGVMVIWFERDPSGGPWSVRAQHFDALGNTVWAAGPDDAGIELAANNTNQTYDHLVIASDPQGGAWGGWSSVNGPSYATVQRLNPAGVPQWLQNGWPISNEQSWWNRLAPLPDGGAWLMDRTGSTIDVTVTPLSAAQPGVNPYYFAGTSAYGQDRYQIGTFPDGRVLTVASNAYHVLKAQAVSVGGARSFIDGGIPLTTLNTRSIDVTNSPDGEPIVVWEQAGPTNIEVHAQKIDGTGNLLWDLDGGVYVGDDNGASGGQSIQPSVASDGVGGAVIVWHGKVGSDRVMAQHVSAAGALMWASPGVLVGITDGYGWARVTRDSDGKYVVVWSDAVSAPLNDRAQRLDDNGNKLWADQGSNGGVIWSHFQITQSVSANAADDLWLVPSGDGVVIAEYHAYDVMLHRLRPDGTLGGPVAIVDAGMPDAGAPDAGPADSGMPDSGVPDAGTPDAGTPDAGAPDAGTPDAGTPDDGGQGNPDGGIKKPIDDGCACSAGSGDPLLVAAALLMLGRVRRKRK